MRDLFEKKQIFYPVLKSKQIIPIQDIIQIVLETIYIQIYAIDSFEAITKGY